MAPKSAAIVTVGSELVEGLRVDTNTAEIARALGPRGFAVHEAVSIGDHEQELTATLARLCARHALVICTGGLGPTHDDITRLAASRALGKALSPDLDIAEQLRVVAARHSDPEAQRQVFRQADVLDGAEVLPATTGTAPGQIVGTDAGLLALLPGPPSEMRSMLGAVVDRFPLVRSEARELAVVGLSESDVQVVAQRALSAYPGVALTVLAKPGDVRVLLLDEGVGGPGLDEAAAHVRSSIGEACYSDDGRSLSEVVVGAAVQRGMTIATAESCTGGMIAAALTDVAGASAAVLGGIVAYDNAIKRDVLAVSESTLDQYGAVSEQTACEMAAGVARLTLADVCVSVTGIAGPDGGSPDKPVGLVWFGLATRRGVVATERRFLSGSRGAIRSRATAVALDMIRRELLGID